MTNRKPDFEGNLLKVINRERPSRATLFELFFDYEFCCKLVGHGQEEAGLYGRMKFVTEAMNKAGYDYATCYGCDMQFRPKSRERASTISLNGDSLITDWETFEKFQWPEVENNDFSSLEKIKPYLPDGMKLMVMGPGGVLENVIDLVGYDNLCIMLYDDPELAGEIFNRVGEILVKYYEISSEPESVGVLMSNDDWGFNTQTFLSPADMRKYVFPWHKKIVETVHKHKKPCLLHSCGYYNDVIDDVINDMKYDGRHSYEDNIVPVEDAYEQLHGRIAVMGGIDVNFLAMGNPDEIYKRSREMLERVNDRGGYALGSGNSIAKYIPLENYLAMQRAAIEF